jgi:hypothetical protein
MSIIPSYTMLYPVAIPEHPYVMPSNAGAWPHSQALKNRISVGEAAVKRAADHRVDAEKQYKKLKRCSAVV